MRHRFVGKLQLACTILSIVAFGRPAAADAQGQAYVFCPVLSVCGYIDGSANWLLEPNYDALGDPSESGIGLVRAGDRFTYINLEGQNAFGLYFDESQQFQSNGLAVAGRGGVFKKMGLINEKGEWVVEPQFRSISSFSENGLASIKDGLRYGYINELGEVVIPPIYYNASSFSETGIARVDLMSSTGVPTGKTKFISASGDEVEFEGFKVNPIKDLSSDGKSAGFVTNFFGLRWSVINGRGYPLAQPVYEKIYDFASNGLAVANVDGRYGYIGTDGNIVIAPNFSWALKFSSNGLAYAKDENKKVGFITADGQWKIQPKFDTAASFNESGLAIVGRKSENGVISGVIDGSGEWMIEPLSAQEASLLTRYRGTDALISAARNKFYSQIDPSDQALADGIQLARVAAKLGNAEASYLIAYAYAYGFGLHQDVEAAAEWLESASNRGFDSEKVAKVRSSLPVAGTGGNQAPPENCSTELYVVITKEFKDLKEGRVIVTPPDADQVNVRYSDGLSYTPSGYMAVVQSEAPNCVGGAYTVEISYNGESHVQDMFVQYEKFTCQFEISEGLKNPKVYCD